MSEFKFACPVCGQHLTVATTDAGTPIDCPTCFQKIIVPSFQGTSETKLVISGKKAEERKIPISTLQETVPAKRDGVSPALTGLLLLIGTAALAYFFFGSHWLPGNQNTEPVITNAPVAQVQLAHEESPVPTHIRWTLLLTNATIPAEPVVGRIHGQGFRARRVVFHDGALTFRQGEGWPPDLGVTVRLPVSMASRLSGQTYEFQPGNDYPLPRLTLRWKDEERKPNAEVITNEFAMKVVFGEASSNRIPGQIYLAVPDEQKSFIAGQFQAEIRTQSVRKKAPPKAPGEPYPK